MSLLVWLPLDGNLDNQGCSDLVFSNTDTAAITINTNGKIGSCYQRSAIKTAGYITSDKNILLDGDLSMCCWAKVTATVGDTANGLVSNHSAENNAGFGITVKQVSTSDYRLSCSTGNGSSRTYMTYYGTTNIKDNWHHLTLTYNHATKEVQLWVDGVVEKTQTYTNSARADKIMVFQWNTTGTNNNYKPACLLNDVRIYNHCLSAAEVHEISQGLVLHYKLNDMSNPNLLLNTATAVQHTANISTTNNYSVKDIYTMQAPVNQLFTEGEIVTFSFNWSYTGSSNTGNFHTEVGNVTPWGIGTVQSASGTRNTTSNYIDITDTNTSGHVKVTYIVSNAAVNAADGFKYFRIRKDNTPDGSILTFSHCKLERGAIETRWIPNINDKAWNTLGYNKNIIFDSSGYNNNTIMATTISSSPDTPRYTTSIVTTGTYGTMTLPLGTTQRNAEMTWCGWIKRNYDTATTKTIFNGNVQIYLHTNFHIRISWTHATDSTTAANTWDPGVTIPKDTWTHVALTFKDGYLKCYINGEHKGNSDRISTGQFIYGNRSNIFLSGNSTVGDASQFIGQVSDIRLYVTELSAADIKELYEVSAKIDNKGNIHSYELNETTSSSITKQGLIEGKNFIEMTNFAHLKYDSNIHIEPDGSAWLHIFHHNNPATYKFASTDTFTAGVYKDENRWFNFDICNDIDKWEFLAAVTRTVTDTEERYRWIQSANPFTATFDQTKVANVTRITDGYNTISFGGLYHVTASSWFAMNNGTNNNWFGAVGCWTAWNNGIPGWKSTTASDAISTGKIDIYVRIDNIVLTNPTIAKLTKNNIWCGNNIIER